MIKYTNPRINSKYEVIESLRKHFNGDANNKFSFALSSVIKKFRNIIILTEESDGLKKQYKILLDEIGSEIKLHKYNYDTNRQALITDCQVKLEIKFETMLMFGSIMCDEISHLIILLFGNERGIKLGGHRHLSRNFQGFCNAKGIKVNSEMITLASELEINVCDFRDKQIVHDFSPRKIDVINFNNGGDLVYMVGGYLTPKKSDQYSTSLGWNEIIDMLEKYLFFVFDLIFNNIEFIKLNLEKSSQL